MKERLAPKPSMTSILASSLTENQRQDWVGFRACPHNGEYKMKTIDSAANPYFKILTKLSHSSGIKKEGLFLISGNKVIQEVLDNYSRMVESILITDGQLEGLHEDSILKYFEKKFS